MMNGIYHPHFSVCARCLPPENLAKRMARAGTEGADLRVQSVTRIATKKVAQLINGKWNAVVKSVGKGIFLIRRRRDRLASQCPLLRYEVEIRGNTNEY